LAGLLDNSKSYLYISIKYIYLKFICSLPDYLGDIIMGIMNRVTTTLHIPEYHLLSRQLQPFDIAVGIAIITALSWSFFFLLRNLSNAQKQKTDRPSTPDLEQDRLKKPTRKFGGVLSIPTNRKSMHMLICFIMIQNGHRLHSKDQSQFLIRNGT
jgi:hypothetical protein